MAFFLGHTARDHSLRVLLQRLWSGRGIVVRSWAIARDADAQEKKLWARYDVDLHAADLAKYAKQLEQRWTFYPRA